MVNFGDRVKAVRKELGLSQGDLVNRLGVGFDQPRVSKIERGTLAASAEVIDKMAAVFKRSGRELAQGTDREGYYFAQGMSPDQRAAERAVQARTVEIMEGVNAMSVMMLKTTYGMVFDLFEAVYGGDYVAPQVSAEEGYVELRSHCMKLAKAVDKFAPGTSERLYFPDHIESRDDMDMLMDDWKIGERGMVKESLALLFDLSEGYRNLVAPADLDEVKKHFKLDEGEKAIAALRAQRKNIEASFRKKYFDKA
jgi:transcriptional regulator with XRE-family HTH domain